eukprot:scaffold132282_cov17-Tisochrysis_lutea.AAC.1
MASPGLLLAALGKGSELVPSLCALMQHVVVGAAPTASGRKPSTNPLQPDGGQRRKGLRVALPCLPTRAAWLEHNGVCNQTKAMSGGVMVDGHFRW